MKTCYESVGAIDYGISRVSDRKESAPSGWVESVSNVKEIAVPEKRVPEFGFRLVPVARGRVLSSSMCASRSQLIPLSV